ncbi:histidine-rich glycoprotein-like [Drosophila miranda]|uniref:histidine-rich glycoprotein-like n=1 Tax=Drosophila miranda TaxID=7229 RepID=UPI0007E8A57E|nr:histidine-rich glycoprotein-like [Drosophila miranda]
MFKEIIILATLLAAVALALAMHPVEENHHHRQLAHHTRNGHLKTVKHHSHDQEHIQHGKLAVPPIASHVHKQHTQSASHKKPGQSKATKSVQGQKKHRHLHAPSNQRSKNRNQSHDGNHHQKRHSGSRRHF